MLRRTPGRPVSRRSGSNTRPSAFLAALAATTLAACSSGASPTVETGPIPTAAPVGSATSTSSAPAQETLAPLYGGLGPHARTIVTSSDRAQAYFDEGLLFMYAFGTSIARASFRSARMEDPGCAACWWGEAWSWSSYLNGGMPPDNERQAYAAIQTALERKAHASAVEQALIDAFAVRYEAEPNPDRRRSLDSLYAREMEEVARRFPDDLDVQTLYAEALMLLRPRRGSVDLEADDVKRILPVLEGVLAKDVRHPGACHLYIHLVEASQNPGLAEACADDLGDAIAVSHIRHMPSHIYMNIGRYADAVRSNQRAWHADQMADFGGPPGVYPSHNLHMLLFAAVLDGQSAVAIQAAKDLAREQGSWAWYYPVTLAHFGRWTEILEATARPEDPFHRAMWHYAFGLARLRTDHADGAPEDLAAMDRIIAGLDPEAQFRFHAQATLLQIPRSILAAEIAHDAGRGEEAVALLEHAVEVEDGLVYDEPEPWHQPARHFLGAILLRMNRPVEAEAVYREALIDHQDTGWALFGLRQALDAQGRTAAAQEAGRDFERHWARADIWLRSSRF